MPFFKKPLNIKSLYRLIVVGIEIAQSKDNGGSVVRSTVINKILSFQYRLGKLIGRRKAGRVCILIEKTFTNLFGREAYSGGK